MVLVLLVLAFGAEVATADLLFAIGVRETSTDGPVGDNGGVDNGIEFVGLDSNFTVAADGAWHQVIIDLGTADIDAFAGTTANSVLATTTGWGVLDHLRIGNTADGVTHYRVWIDEIVNTVNGNPRLLTGFEGFSPGDEVVFHEPRFSGSTQSNLEVTPDVARVTGLAAHAGTRSYVVEFEFVDDTLARWVRLITFDAHGIDLPNPEIAVPGAGGIVTSTLSFRIRLEENPEPLDQEALPGVPALSPGAAALLAVLLGAATLAMLRRRGPLPS